MHDSEGCPLHLTVKRRSGWPSDQIKLYMPIRQKLNMSLEPGPSPSLFFFPKVKGGSGSMEITAVTVTLLQ